MFFALQLDRGNINQALSDNMLNDLNMTTNDYNNGMSIFYCSFLLNYKGGYTIGRMFVLLGLSKMRTDAGGLFIYS